MKSSVIATVAATLAAGASGCAPAQETYDAVVVGAGVVGCCIARELSRWDMRVLVLEAGLDIASGATCANSGIVHVGFDPKPGTLKAKYNVAGTALYPQWQSELGFAYFQNGALVLAFDQDELKTLESLKERGIQNGAQDTQVIGQEELRKKEPNVSPKALGALWAPTSGIVDPYGITFAAAENAGANGVEFLFGREVTGIAKEGALFTVTTASKEQIRCRSVINAAGTHADTINNMICSKRLNISCRRGEYQLYHNKLHPFNHTMFQAPTAAGKGVLVTHAAFGNLIVGPNSAPQDSKTDVSTTQEGLDEVYTKAKKTWPDLSCDDIISTFAGLRATNADGGDFAIGQSTEVAGFFNAACIDSPGLASAPAIAQDIAAMVAAHLGASENSAFNPYRQSMPPFAFSSDEAKEQLLAQDAAYGTTVCRCCQVTQAEIANVLRGPLGVHSLDAVKWRTGAMMGPCQGSRCLAKIAQLISEELGIALNQLDKRDQGSYIATSGPEPGSTCKAGFAVEAQVADIDDSVIERCRAAYLIPGSRPAGVYSGRGAIELMAQGGLPGQTAVVWGNTTFADEAARLMERGGMSVERIGADARISKICGQSRLQMISVVENGTSRNIMCDTLVISHDLDKAES